MARNGCKIRTNSMMMNGVWVASYNWTISWHHNNYGLLFVFARIFS